MKSPIPLASPCYEVGAHPRAVLEGVLAFVLLRTLLGLWGWPVRSSLPLLCRAVRPTARQPRVPLHHRDLRFQGRGLRGAGAWCARSTRVSAAQARERASPSGLIIPYFDHLRPTLFIFTWFRPSPPPPSSSPFSTTRLACSSVCRFYRSMISTHIITSFGSFFVFSFCLLRSLLRGKMGVLLACVDGASWACKREGARGSFLRLISTAFSFRSSVFCFFPTTLPMRRTHPSIPSPSPSGAAFSLCSRSPPSAAPCSTLRPSAQARARPATAPTSRERLVAQPALAAVPAGRLSLRSVCMGDSGAPPSPPPRPHLPLPPRALLEARARRLPSSCHRRWRRLPGRFRRWLHLPQALVDAMLPPTPAVS